MSGAQADSMETARDKNNLDHVIKKHAQWAQMWVGPDSLTVSALVEASDQVIT
jgi:hypothetical protein